MKIQKVLLCVELDVNLFLVTEKNSMAGSTGVRLIRGRASQKFYNQEIHVGAGPYNHRALREKPQILGGGGGERFMLWQKKL